MKNLKKAVGSSDQHMHNIEDARVKDGAESKKKPERKTKWINEALIFSAKIGLSRFANWILDDPESAWNEICRKAMALLEVLPL